MTQWRPCGASEDSRAGCGACSGWEMLKAVCLLQGPTVCSFCGHVAHGLCRWLLRLQSLHVISVAFFNPL
jgi:hypothetical protein